LPELDSQKSSQEAKGMWLWKEIGENSQMWIERMGKSEQKKRKQEKIAWEAMHPHAISGYLLNSPIKCMKQVHPLNAFITFTVYMFRVAMPQPIRIRAINVRFEDIRDQHLTSLFNFDCLEVQIEESAVLF